MTHIYAIEPLMPDEPSLKLEDLATELVAKASSLAAQIHPITRESIGSLIRSMNCYYSNLIEGHNTHPRDIERALLNDYSKDIKKRELQLEAKAHIEVQQLIDQGFPSEDIISEDFICWIHREFCSRLPDELLWVENPQTKEKIRVTPGVFREGNVQVGLHIPPEPEDIDPFMKRFQQAYDLHSLSRLRQIIAVAASHHRLLWIHPFYGGNGRVTRLFSHAFFRKIGLGDSLWSISRGLARRVGEYRTHLMAADELRRNDFDGRGALSARGLEDFCVFFLEVSIDQVSFMESLLQPKELLRRIESFTIDEIWAKRLPQGSYQLLREAVIVGEFDRGRASSITGYGERQSRAILSELIKKGLLISNTPKGPVRLGFSIDVVERWFPNLYPAF
jgi:Fic family protein